MKKFLPLLALLIATQASAQILLREDTASQIVSVGPFLDAADGTAEGGLTIANTDVRLKANGAADFAKTSGGCTHDINGMYDCTFDATDTATVGRLNISVCVSGAVCVRQNAMVVEEAVFDACCAAGAVTTGAGYTAIPWNAAWDDEVQSEAADAINADTGDTFTSIPDVDTLLSIMQMASVQACDSGSTTTCVDAARTEATTDYWKGTALTVLSGTTAGQSRCVTGFNTNDTITVKPAFTAALSTNSYILVRDTNCAGVAP